MDVKSGPDRDPVRKDGIDDDPVGGLLDGVPDRYDWSGTPAPFTPRAASPPAQPDASAFTTSG